MMIVQYDIMGHEHCSFFARTKPELPCQGSGEKRAGLESSSG
jgi:hypothetical protein